MNFIKESISHCNLIMNGYFLNLKEYLNHFCSLYLIVKCCILACLHIFLSGLRQGNRDIAYGFNYVIIFQFDPSDFYYYWLQSSKEILEYPF